MTLEGRKLPSFFLCAIAALFMSLVLRASIFSIPLIDADEAFFGTFASVLHHGGAPYVSVADNKPPMIFLLYYLVWLIFGEWNFIALRIITAVWVAATGLVIGLIGRELSGEKAGKIAMIFYVIASTLGAPKYLASSINIFLMLPLSLSFYFTIRGIIKKRSVDFFIAGIMASVAMLFRYQGLVIVAIAVVCIFLGQAPWRAKVKRTFLFFCGFISLTLPIFSYLYTTGVFDDFVFWSLEVGLKYSSQGAVFSFLPRFWENSWPFLFANFPFLVLGAYFVFCIFKGRLLGKQAFFLLAWFFISWAAVCVGRRFYGHYYIFLIPSISIMAAVGFSLLHDKFLKNILIVLIVVWISFFYMVRIGSLGLRERTRYSSIDWSEIKEYQCPIGKYVNDMTRPEDKIFVWGFAAPIYYCAGRQPASRFLHTDVLIDRISGGDEFRTTYAGSTEGAPAPAKIWNMLYEDLERNSPAFIIDTSRSAFSPYKGFSMDKYPVYNWMNEHDYKLNAIIGNSYLYSKKIRAHGQEEGL